MPLDPHSLDQAVRSLENGDWRRAHEIVQQDEESTYACWAHGIVHLMEGDVPNARYWYGQARRAFPATGSVEAEVAALRAALPQAKR